MKKRLKELLKDIDSMTYNKDWEKLDYIYNQIELLINPNANNYSKPKKVIK
jgi:hypothetical protein|tara:strand:+ start:53 stop:205 length:153 start_codon:yes stop_codon:yes gene_type:complete